MRRSTVAGAALALAALIAAAAALADSISSLWAAARANLVGVL